MKNCTKRLKTQRRHLNFQSSSVNPMSLGEICFLASRHPCTSCGPHGPSSLIIVSWTRDKQYHVVLCKLSLKEAEIHFVYFWTNILRIIGKYIYYLGISKNKKGKKVVSFRTEIFLSKWKIKRGVDWGFALAWSFLHLHYSVGH